MINRTFCMCEYCQSLSLLQRIRGVNSHFKVKVAAKLVNANELFRCAVELSQTKAN